MKRWMTPLATLAGTAVMLACASAQQAPIPAQGDDTHPSDKQAQKPSVDKKKVSPGQSKKADAKKSDTPADAAKGDAAKSPAADDSEPKPLYNSVTLGYAGWNSSGNNSAMNQHGLVQESACSFLVSGFLIYDFLSFLKGRHIADGAEFELVHES